METPAKQVIAWVNENLPPLSWQIITVQNMNVFMKNKVLPTQITDSTRFNSEILSSINVSIRDRYKKELPSTLFR
jgi:hypothetical protein